MQVNSERQFIAHGSPNLETQVMRVDFMYHACREWSLSAYSF